MWTKEVEININMKYPYKTQEILENGAIIFPDLDTTMHQDKCQCLQTYDTL